MFLVTFGGLVFVYMTLGEMGRLKCARRLARSKQYCVAMFRGSSSDCVLNFDGISDFQMDISKFWWATGKNV